nr:MAG TPA: hypothetical protein [Caudoviricetes sp.]
MITNPDESRKIVTYKVVDTSLTVRQIKCETIVSRETIQIRTKHEHGQIFLSNDGPHELRTGRGVKVLVNNGATFIDILNRYPELFGANVFRVLSTNFNKMFPQVERFETK